MADDPRSPNLARAEFAKCHKPASVADAVRLEANAEFMRRNADSFVARGDHVGARWVRGDAHAMAEAAADYLDPHMHVTATLRPGAGGEMIAATRDVLGRKPGIVDTVRTRPDMLTAEASLNRLDLAADARALVMAVDSAESIQAANSLEKMLAHQMAAAHALAMRFAGQADEELRAYAQSREPARAAEAVRIGAAVSRLMGAYQGGMLTLDRVRRGGAQTVNIVHQHVAVGDGGQAIVGAAAHVPGVSAGGSSEPPRPSEQVPADTAR